MARRTVITGAITVGLLAAFAVASAHDMFLKPEHFILKAGDKVLVRLLNGTFTHSANSIARTRLVEVAIHSPAGKALVDTTRWITVGDTSSFLATVGADGTYLFAASTKPSLIELDAKDFNAYLKEDGLPDPLEDRRKNGELGKDARERYSKHVKALVQVGTTKTGQYATALGYPAEVIPQTNPYDLKVGQALKVKLVVDGKPVANQYTLFGGTSPSGSKIAEVSTRSDAAGIATIPVSGPGVWYIKFIKMAKLTGDPAADYESKWATLTFAVR